VQIHLWKLRRLRSFYPGLILQLAAINKGAFGLRATGDAPYHCGAVTVQGSDGCGTATDGPGSPKAMCCDNQ